MREDSNRNVHISLQALEGGVKVGGLRLGNHLRVFTSSGMLILSKKYDGPERFVPLQSHDVYLISTGEEIVKYSY